MATLYNSKSILPVLLLTLILSVSAAFGQKADERLVGKWEVADIMPADPDNYDEETYSMSGFFIGLRFEYFEDGKIEVSPSFEQSQYGTFTSSTTGYEVKKKKKTEWLIYHQKDGSQLQHEIILLKEDDLHYKTPIGFIYELKRRD